MKAAAVLRIILAYALVLMPSCKERRETSEVLDVPVDSSGEIRYDAWYQAAQDGANSDSRTSGVMGEFTRDVFKESMKGQEITAWAINPEDPKSKRKLNSPTQFLEKGEELFLQVSEDNPFLFQISARTIRKRKVSYMTLGAFKVKKGVLKRLDGTAFTMRLGLANKEQMEAEFKSMMHKISSFNALFVDIQRAPGDKSGFNLQGDEQKASNFDKVRMVVGLMMFGLMTYMIMLPLNPTKKGAIHLALFFAVSFFLVIVGSLVLKAIGREVFRILNDKFEKAQAF